MCALTSFCELNADPRKYLATVRTYIGLAPPHCKMSRLVGNRLLSPRNQGMGLRAIA